MNRARASAVVATTVAALAAVAWSAPLLASPDRPPPRSGFGSAVVLDDGVAYVGRPGEYALFPIPSNQPGAVHLFEAGEGESWVEAGVVRASDGAVGDGFGSTLDVSGGWMVVGAPGASGGAARPTSSCAETRAGMRHSASRAPTGRLTTPSPPR